MLFVPALIGSLATLAAGNYVIAWVLAFIAICDLLAADLSRKFRP